MHSTEIRTSQQAEELCRTAEATPPPTCAPDEADPVLRANRRREYSQERNRRLTDVYEVVLDTHEYHFLPSELGLITVATLRPFSLFGGVFALDLGESPDFSFGVSERQFDEIAAGVASDQVLLRLHFQLVSLDDPQRSYCEPGDGGTTRLLGRLIAAELLARQDQRALAQAETERYERTRVRFGFDVEVSLSYQPPQPRVTVTSASFSAPELSQAEAEVQRVEAEARMTPCYMQGLSRNGRLQGAMVVSYEVGTEGQVRDPSVTIDTIGHPTVSGCVVEALAGMPVRRSVAAGAYDARLTVIFRLE